MSVTTTSGRFSSTASRRESRSLQTAATSTSDTARAHAVRLHGRGSDRCRHDPIGTGREYAGARSPSRRAGPGPLVLIVDDDARNLKLARDVLRAARFRTLVAGNGTEAVALGAEHLPDVILMDLRLPDMDGAEAARMLADGSRTATIPVVALSAVTLQETSPGSHVPAFPATSRSRSTSRAFRTRYAASAPDPASPCWHPRRTGAGTADAARPRCDAGVVGLQAPRQE